MLPAQIRIAGDAISGATISPVSHLSATLALRLAAQGAAAATALQTATALVDGHFGGLGWTSLGALPDLTVAGTGVVQLNDASRAELIVAGLSQEAKNLSIAKNLTPGGALNSLTLLAALANDLSADGFFDG